MIDGKHLFAAALIIPALIVGAWTLMSGGGPVIPIVGAGSLSQLTPDDAPESVRYRLDTRPHESLDATRARVEEAITRWPDVIVFGLDERAAREAPEEAATILDALAQQVENATGAAVIVLDESTQALAETTCMQGRWRVCVNLSDANDVPAAVAAGVRDGIAAHDALRATTQTGR